LPHPVHLIEIYFIVITMHIVDGLNVQ